MDVFWDTVYNLRAGHPLVTGDLITRRKQISLFPFLPVRLATEHDLATSCKHVLKLSFTKHHLWHHQGRMPYYIKNHRSRIRYLSKKFANFNEFSEIRKFVKIRTKNSLNASVKVNSNTAR